MARPPREARLGMLFDALDEAAVEPAAWSKVCDAIAGLVDAKGAFLVPAEADDRGLALPRSPRLEAAFERYIDEGWHRQDFRARGFPIALRKGFVTDLDLIRPERMPKHPYYAELLQPAGLKWFAGVAYHVRGKLWGASVHRGPAEEPFSPRDIETLLHLRDHLSLAARHAALLGQSRLQAIEGTLSAAERGIVAVGWTGRIAWSTPAGEARIRDFELLRRGRVGHRDAMTDRKLRSLVDHAISHRPGLKLRLPHPVLVTGRDKRTLFVDALPMPRDYAGALTGTAALVTLREVALPRSGMRAKARERFRLTAREAELAGEIAEGKALAPAAAALGISLWTAKQHLKSVFFKTGVHRQAELVALLSSLSDQH